MRSSGPVASVHDLGPSDHVCCPHVGDDDFRSRVLSFLGDGVALGERIAYAGPSAPDALVRGLRSLDPSVEILPVDATYRAGAVAGPEAQVRSYADATADAVRRGYTGLRVAAEATTLVRTSAQRDAFVRYEHLIDRAMRSMPFTAMCGYHRDVLGDEAVAELACVHPLVVDGLSRFQLFAGSGTDLAVTGEVDAVNAPAFSVALARTCSALARGAVVIDATGLNFVDHHGMVALEQLERPVLLQDAPRVAGRLAALLELRHVRAEVRT